MLIEARVPTFADITVEELAALIAERDAHPLQQYVL